MGRQREQMTLNNPDILFIHLSAVWKDEISYNEIFYVESIMHFEYLYLYIFMLFYHCIFYHSFSLHDVLMKKSLSR